MRILIISSTGYGAGVASHLSNEGHATTTYVGSIPHMSNIFSTSTPDVALFDSPTFTGIADWVRSRGVKVLGVSSWSALIDTNPEYKLNLIKAIGYKFKEDVTGIHVIVSGWFNGQKFISKCIVFNYDKMLAGDIGATIDSAGFVAYYKLDDSKLIIEALTPVERFLRKAGHKGCFNVSCVIDSAGEVYVDDINANMNKPYTQAIFENSKKGKSDILLDVFNEGSDSIEHLDSYVCGVLLSVYPFPHSAPSNPLELLGINMHNLKHIWRMDFGKSDDKWLCGTMSGCLGYVTARGDNLQEAARRAYRTISNISIDGLQYRNDISKGIGEKMHKLREHKLIGG